METEAASRRYAWIAIAVPMALFVGVVLCVLNAGFVCLSADEFIKSVLSWDLLHGKGAIQHRVWLPGHFFLTAGMLSIVPSLFWAPRIVTILFGLLALWGLHGIAERFLGRRGAFLTALLAATGAPLVWISATGLTDVMYAALALCGLRFWFRWEERPTERPGALMAAFLWFGCGNVFHYHAWVVCAVAGAATFLKYVITPSLRRSGRAWAVISAAAVLAAAFPIAWFVHQWFAYGHPFYFWTHHSSASAGFFRDDDNRFHAGAALIWIAGAYVKLQRFGWVLAPPGLLVLLVRKARAGSVWLVLIGGLILAAEIALILSGGMPTAYGPRILLIPVLIGLILCVAFIEELLRNEAMLIRACGLCLVALVLAVNLGMTARWPDSMSPTIRPVGRDLGRFLAANPHPLVIEMKYWDTYGIMVHANKPALIRLDRADRLKRGPANSSLHLPWDEQRRRADAEGTRYAFAYSDEAKAIFERDGGLTPALTVQGWNLYDMGQEAGADMPRQSVGR